MRVHWRPGTRRRATAFPALLCQLETIQLRKAVTRLLRLGSPSRALCSRTGWPSSRASPPHRALGFCELSKESLRFLHRT